MLASSPASMVNQKPPDLGIPNRFKLTSSRFKAPRHGLRVTFAAEIKRVTGANDDQLAAALGDRDTRMGAHYTRHVEQENKIIYLFASQTMGTRTERDLENGKARIGKRRAKSSKAKPLEEKGGL